MTLAEEFFCLILSFRVVKKYFHKAILFTIVVFAVFGY